MEEQKDPPAATIFPMAFCWSLHSLATNLLLSWKTHLGGFRFLLAALATGGIVDPK